MKAATTFERRQVEVTASGDRHLWVLVCRGLIAATVLCLLADAFFDRSFRNIDDGVAYLDLSHEIARGDAGALVNGYWSPAYPVALYLGLRVLRPSPAHELAAVYLINCFIGILALACLWYFVRGLPEPGEHPGTFGLSRPMLTAFACALFLIAIRADAPVDQITPDLLLGAWLWLAGGVFLRIVSSQRLIDYALLGIALSLAYFTKAVALPLAIVALLILPFAGAKRDKAIRGAVLYLVVLSALVSPFIAGLSAAKGRFTFGDTGSLNYAWIVDGSDRYELREDSQHGHARMQLVHPVRALLASPPVFEFASPVPGTLPVLDDPSYWDDGLKPVFYWKGELWHIAMNSYHTLSWLAKRGAFVFALMLFLFAQWRCKTPGPLRFGLPVLLWLAALWGMYWLVDVEPRYVFAVLTAVLVILAAMVRLPDLPRLRQTVAMVVLILVCGTAIVNLGSGSEKIFYDVKSKSMGPYDNPYWHIGRTLKRKLNLSDGDRVACMENGCANVYWASLAGVRVTADVNHEADYWNASPADRAKVLAVLSGAGVKALIARYLDEGAESEGWIPIGGDLYARPTQ